MSGPPQRYVSRVTAGAISAGQAAASLTPLSRRVATADEGRGMATPLSSSTLAAVPGPVPVSGGRGQRLVLSHAERWLHALSWLPDRFRP